MKKIIGILICLPFVVMTFAQSTTVAGKKSYNNYPMGYMQVDTFSYVGATLADTLHNNATYICTCPYALGNTRDTLHVSTTVNLSIPTVTTTGGTKYAIPVGSIVYIEFLTNVGATRTVTLGAGFVPKTISGTAQKRNVIECIFNGVAFRAISVYAIE